MKICVVIPGKRLETAPIGRAGCALGLITGLTISPHQSVEKPTPTAETAETASFDRPVLSERLILRQAQDERRVEGLRMSAHGELVEPCVLCGKRCQRRDLTAARVSRSTSRRLIVSRLS